MSTVMQRRTVRVVVPAGVRRRLEMARVQALLVVLQAQASSRLFCPKVPMQQRSPRQRPSWPALMAKVPHPES